MAKVTPGKPRRKSTRPQHLRTKTVFPRGPKFLQVEVRTSGPGEPPPGFITPTNSRSEWWVYWALCKILGFPRDPRQGPWLGYPGLWVYQSPYDGGRITGGQVIDFVIFSAAGVAGATALRIQTERYHVLADSAKQAVDAYLAGRLSRYYRVIDLYEQDFIEDASGQAVIIQLKRLLFGGSSSNPLRAGYVRRTKAA